DDPYARERLVHRRNGTPRARGVAMGVPTGPAPCCCLPGRSSGPSGSVTIAVMTASRTAVDFAAMMALDEQGADRFVATGPAYPWGVLYGGQVVAQGLRAAAATVGPDRR